eukprot:GHVH01015741.1.p1 GENE.GHVH01015741.1~~GHVH01015741.1.p1  ORF type:complete len:350 (-),score=71.38 GHVH01015741.1:64-1065(-)
MTEAKMNDATAVAETEFKIREMVQERNLINSHLSRRGGARGGGGMPRGGGAMGNFESRRFSGGAVGYQRGGSGLSGSPSVVSGSNCEPIQTPPRRSLLTTEDVTIEARPPVAEKLDKATITRGSRLLGGLMGHLKKAKTEDEASKNDPLLRKKVFAEQVVEKRLTNFTENLKEAHRLEAVARKNEDLARMRELRIDIQVEERKLLRLKLEEHYQPMMNFLRTESDPSLFYKPAKSSKLTEDMAEDTQAKINGKLATLRGVFDEDLLRQQLREKQLEWNIEHPLRELEFRDRSRQQQQQQQQLDVKDEDNGEDNGEDNVKEVEEVDKNGDVTIG